MEIIRSNIEWKQWLMFYDNTAVSVEHVTYGSIHRVPRWYLKPTASSSNALLFWVRRKSLRRTASITFDIDGIVVDQVGEHHKLINHNKMGQGGSSIFNSCYIWELANTLPENQSFRFCISIVNYEVKETQFVEFECSNSSEWQQQIAETSQSYMESDQRMIDDVVFSIIEDDSKAFKKLIYSGYRLSDMTVLGYNDLCYAINKNDIETVVYLIQHGANIEEACGTGQSPLMLSVINGNRKLIMELLRLGASLSTVDMYGKTALYYAIKSKSKEIITLVS